MNPPDHSLDLSPAGSADPANPLSDQRIRLAIRTLEALQLRAHKLMAASMQAQNHEEYAFCLCVFDDAQKAEASLGWML